MAYVPGRYNPRHAKVGRKDAGEFYNPRVRKIVRKTASRYLGGEGPLTPHAQKHIAQSEAILNRVFKKHGTPFRMKEDFLMTGNSPANRRRQLTRAKKTGYY